MEHEGEAHHARALVGEVFSVPPFDVDDDGSFEVVWPIVSLPGDSNPLTASVLEVEAEQGGTLCPRACGRVAGQITEPVILDISGSTWFMEPGSAANHTEPPIINCDGDSAGSL